MGVVMTMQFFVKYAVKSQHILKLEFILNAINIH